MEEKEFIKARAAEMLSDAKEAVEFESVRDLFWTYVELHRFLKKYMAVVKGSPDIATVLSEIYDITAVPKKDFIDLEDEINDIIAEKVKVSFDAVAKWFKR